jgi:hypothetical protein
MTALEIILIIIGLIIFGGSFFISEKITASSEQLKAAIDLNEVKKLIQLQINNMSDEIDAAINEAVENSTGGVQRSMEKLSNEKIMAINEYSDTVMDAINKNHNEVMFLYGMLNDKNKEIKDTAELITKANKGINKKINESQEVIQKMDIQISEMNKLTANQKESIDKLAKSASTIEILEEQINNIEQMAVQFSKDIKANEVNVNRQITQSINEEQNSMISELEGLDQETNDLNFEELEENNFERVFEEVELEEENDDDMEEILENFYNEKIVNYKNEEDNSYNSNNRILEMSKNGQSALEIAKSLGLGVGEVQLVIDLFVGGRR